MNTKTKLLTALSLILLTVFLATSLINYAVTREAVRDELLYSSLPLTGKNIYSEIHSELMRPLLVSSTMANDAFLKQWAMQDEEDMASLAKYLQEINEKYDFLTTFFVSAKTDNYYYQKGLHKKINPRNPHDIWYFAFTRSKKEYRLEVDTNEAKNNVLTIFVNFRVEDSDGKLLGVAGVGVNMDHAASKLIEARKEFFRMAYLVDQDGLIQVHPNKSLIEKEYITDRDGIKNVAENILTTREDGSNFEYDHNGKHYLLATRYIPEFEWHLIVVQDEDEALDAARSNFVRTLSIGFASSLLILFLCVLAVNHFQGQLEYMAKTDPLTGAANRRELKHRFELSTYAASRYKGVFSIIVIDLDRFKAINDKFGHLEGDRFLKTVAEVISATIRPTDLLARWGGDEFIILMDGSADDASTLDNRIRSALISSRETPISFSSGITEFKANDNILSMTQRADEAMYKAKARGGDCAVTI
ncbi:MAG: diguanylate cyclase [Pseudodesulfovibrio sp.]|nr:diguanylate cyclase [Pseudodesulfovibrio sp.]